MTIAQTYLAELNHESAVTRKMLERVPFDQLSWQPHEKSMNILRIAQHIANIPVWINRAIEADEFDFAKFVYSPPVPATNTELLEQYNESVKNAEKALSEATDEDLNKLWTLKRGDHVMFTMPKTVIIRNFAMNHIVHHRGQLSVYLRLLEIPVPGAYGPSADEA